MLAQVRLDLTAAALSCPSRGQQPHRKRGMSSGSGGILLGFNPRPSKAGLRAR